MGEHPIAELTVERFDRAGPRLGVAVAAGAAALVREAKIHSIGSFDCLSIVRMAAPVTGQYSRERKVPGGATRVSSTGHPPLALDYSRSGGVDGSRNVRCHISSTNSDHSR